MAKKKDKYLRHCSICGTEYRYCSRGCGEFAHLEPWHDAYDQLNCKELYNVCAGYVNGWLAPEVEAARLAKLDLSYIDKLPQWMKDAIKAMQSIDTTNAAAINEALSGDVKEEVTEVKETVVEKKPEEKPIEEPAEEKVEVKETAPEEKLGEKVHREFKQYGTSANKYKPKVNSGKK